MPISTISTQYENSSTHLTHGPKREVASYISGSFDVNGHEDDIVHEISKELLGIGKEIAASIRGIHSPR
jgi:hypothetical protein